jgi:DNA-binding NtrC family response regulator
MKILVVDDEQLVRWFLDRALRKSGHEVITASGILDAFKKLEADDFQVLFLDLRMPEGSGTELLGRLEKLKRRPKVIVCSAFITTELEEDFKNKGICTLKKPFKLEELNNTLRRCLS